MRRDPLFPYFFSNVPAVGAGLGDGTITGGGSGGGISLPGGSNIVTTANFAEVLGDNLVIREGLKSIEDPVPSPANRLEVVVATVKANTESVYLNGVLQHSGADYDYTMSGQVITFTFDLEEDDSVFITYIKEA